MTTHRYSLRNDQWERIQDLILGREGYVGANGKDNRLFVEAVLYRYHSGIPWRDLPGAVFDSIRKFKPSVTWIFDEEFRRLKSRTPTWFAEK